MSLDKPLEIDPNKMFGKSISQKDGHILYCSELTGFKGFIKQSEQFNTLTSNQIKLLKVISLTLESSDSDYVLIKSLEDNTSFNRKSINTYILKLHKVKVINTLDFVLINSTKLPQLRCYGLPTSKNFIDIFPDPELRTEQLISAKSRKDIHNNSIKALSNYDLPESVLENSATQGIYPTGLPPFETMLPTKKHKSNNYLTTIIVKKKKIVVEVKSTSNVMIDEDLKTLYTLMTLSINHQSNLVDYYLQKQILPQNTHYVAIRHIMNVLGKSSAGSYYTAFAKSVMRIKNTVFDLHALEAMFVDGAGDSFFASREFRFFEECTPLSSQGPVILTNENDEKFVSISPKAFIISWNKKLFQKMLSDKYFFVIPLEILSAPTIIFLVYIFLRNQFSFDKSKNLDLTVEDLHKKLNSSALVHNFRRDLTNQLNSWNKGKSNLPKDGKSTIDISGFICKIITSASTISTMRFSLDPQKMLSHVGIEASPKGMLPSGKPAAPTMANPIQELIPLISFKENRGDEFPSEIDVKLLMAPTNLLREVSYVKRNAHVTNINCKTATWEISAYTSDSEILTISETIHDLNKSNTQTLGDFDTQGFLFARIQKARSSLALLGWRQGIENKTISVHLFDDLLHRIYQNHNLLVESSNLFYAIKANNMLSRLLTSGLVGEQIDQAVQRIYSDISGACYTQSSLSF